MPHVLVGTAGHVDHGKTRLVEALTGIDCDRWAEEKRRGITIDLGFAHLEEGDLQIGFVDVPGHERFLHNALAGLGGIRVMLLVVAADEGVKPQTREHLAICELLAIPMGLAVITKKDLVDESRLRAVHGEVAQLLATTAFGGASILTVSNSSGEGVEQVRAALLRIARDSSSEAALDRPARLPIDRAFQLKGLGLVVTGTLASGSVEPGAGLELLPVGTAARVRGVQVHGTARGRAEAGERTALQLAGVEAESIERGMELVEPGSFATTMRLLSHVKLLPELEHPLRGPTPIRLHVFASEVVGRARPLAGAIGPGGSGFVELRLASPVVAARGDRIILRRPSPPATLGGGRVLDPSWRTRRGAALRAVLAALGADDGEAVRLWVEEAAEAGIEAEELALRLGERRAAAERRLAELAAAGGAVRFPEGPGHAARWVVPRALRRLAERAERLLADYFATHRLAEGMPRAEAVARLLPGRAAALAGVYLKWLAREGRLGLEGDRVVAPGRKAALTDAESSLAVRLLARLEASGLEPPSPGALATELAAKPQVVDGVLAYLREQGKVTRLPQGLLIATAAVEGLRRDLALGPARFTVGDFKQRFGLSRKWAIPLLEHLDSVGATRRVGNERQVVRRPG
jgi:selenocysteine-specific elongation factor